jgi:hypothetical protein
VGVRSIGSPSTFTGARRVDLQRADLQSVAARRSRRADAAQDRADAEHELLRAERLREIVVGAEREPWMRSAPRAAP